MIIMNNYNNNKLKNKKINRYTYTKQIKKKQIKKTWEIMFIIKLQCYIKQ